MTIYETRYQSQKNKIGDQVIVKVSGGYTLMEPQDYRVWRCQK